jgi:arabinogalactan oligomer/maltooligosaccharide transport system permease protein
VLLGLVGAFALQGVPLVDARAEGSLGVEVAVLIIVASPTCAAPVPLKYLLPGTLLLIAFQIVPVLSR